MWRVFFVVLILAFSALLGSEHGHSESSPATSKVRAEYFRLRNNDPTGSDPVHQASWERLAQRMRSVLGAKNSDSESLRLRLLAADTHLRLFRRTRNKGYLAPLAGLLEPLLGHERSRLVDSDTAAHASILLGDASLYGGDEVTARERYRRVLSHGGAVAVKARQRITGIDNGTYQRFLPADDLEVPAVVSGQGVSGGRVGSPIIVLDPGHGGEDGGAASHFGGAEKEITLDIARRVRSILESRYGFRVRLTRHSDQFVPLARRTAMANRNEASVFVSLHVNASVGHNLDGLEVYYLDNTNDEASRKLAERENGVAPGEGLDDLSFMLSDLIQSGKLEDSIVLSRSVEGALKRSVVAPSKGLRSLGVKRAPFFVLVGAHMPCTLVEMFFIDHPSEGRRLAQDGFRDALAFGLADGIRNFLNRR